MRNLEIYNKKIEEILKFKEKTNVISLKMIEEIESKYNFQLPDEYVVFMVNFGNEKIFKHLINLIEISIKEDNKHLKKSVYSDLNTYNEFCESIKNEKRFDTITNRMFDGALEIAHLGCTFYLYLFINGEKKGKVLEFSYDSFSYKIERLDFEEFLDWYIDTCEYNRDLFELNY